jgi:hypothetical protein
MGVTRMLATIATASLLAACGGKDTTAPATPASVAIRISEGTSPLRSGTSLTLVAEVRDSRGRAMSNQPVVWSSSNTRVARISTTGVVTGEVAGDASISASLAGVTGTLSVQVTPGAPTVLVMRTQPGDARAGVVVARAPVVEVRDVAGNITNNATVTVSAAMTQGAGVLRGTTVITTGSGLATFSDLAVDGPTGDRVLTFSATGLLPVTSAAFAVASGPATRIVVRTQPQNVRVALPIPVAPVIEVRDAFGNPATTESPVTAQLQGPGTLSGTTSVRPIDGVATFADLVVNGLVGPRTLVFSLSGISVVNSDPFVLQAGPAAALTLRRAPAGAGLNGPFATQPQFELRDVSGNLAVDAGTTITATIAAGGGTLTGATVGAGDGQANFVNLGIVGTPGTRTLSFGGPGLSPLPVTITPCDAGRPPRLVATPAALVLSGVRLRTAVVDSITITDGAASCAPLPPVNTAVTYSGSTGWLAVFTRTGEAGFVFSASAGALATGTYTASVTATAQGTTPLTVPVTFTVRPPQFITITTPAARVNEMDVGSTLRLGATVRDEAGATVTAPVTFRSRAPSIATIATDGTVTAVRPGQAWLLASEPTGSVDSVFVSVRLATGPVLRLDLNSWQFARGGAFTVNVVLDTRGTTVSAGELLLAWPTNFRQPGMLTLTSATLGTTGSPQLTTDIDAGLTRISVASAGGFSGAVVLARLEFNSTTTGASVFSLRAVELLAPNGSSLLGATSALTYPVVIR